jgi:hypothetical protein
MWQIYQNLRTIINWVFQLPDHWGPVAISGNKILAVKNHARLWLFNGSTWVEEQPAGNVNKYWLLVGISGNNMVAVEYHGLIYYNNGSGWVPQNGVGQPNISNWTDVSICGNRILVVSAYIAFSYNGMVWYYNGSTWAYIWSEPTDVYSLWRGCSISDNHAVMTRGTDVLYFVGGDIAQKINWYFIGLGSITDWYSVDIYDDHILLGATNPGRLWLWDGFSWTEQQPAGDIDRKSVV